MSVANLNAFPHTVGNLDDRPNLAADDMKAAFEKDCMDLWNKVREVIPDLNAKLPASDIVKIINSTSTDAKVPTAKAVYDAIADALLGVGGTIAETIIKDWLDDHPEATTTVTDGSITNAKLATSFASPGVASAYSSSATYTVGDYVFYNGSLYRCITAINTAEAWTAAHWTQIYLGDDTAALIGSVKDRHLYIGDLIQNEYVEEDGTITPYTNWDRTDYLDVSRMYSIFVSKGRAGAYNCFFDEDKQFVSSFSIAQDGTTVYVPSNAKYVMVSDLDDYMEDLIITYTLKSEYNSDKAVKYVYPTASLANGTDYDTLLTIGAYAVPTNASAASMVNCPIPNSHRLDILQVTQSNKLIQIVTPAHNEGAVWYRLYNSESFGPWHSVGLSSSDDASIPAYYDSHVKTKEEAIRKNISSAGFSGASFAIVADTHWGLNSKNSPALINHIAKNTPVNKLMFMGDYYITQSSKALAYKAMHESLGSFKGKGMDLYIIPGNHDYNHGTTPGFPILTEEEVYGQIMTEQDNVVKSEDSCTFYVDNEHLKIRYYFTSCMHDSSYSTDSYEWIFRQMESIPSGYKVIIFTHTGLNGPGSGRNHQYAYLLTGALKALKNKTTYSFNGKTFDYTNTDATPIAIFSGHGHVDCVFSDNGIACIQVTTDSYHYEDSKNYPDADIPTLTRDLGTVSEQAFDVATIDTSNDIVYLTRVGAGNNRIVHCNQTTVTDAITLTSSLSGTLTWMTNNGDVAVVSNGTVTKVESGVCMVSAWDGNGNVEFWNISC